MKTKIVIEFSERWLKIAISQPSPLSRGAVSRVVLEPLLESEAGNFSGALSRILKEIKQKKGVEVIVVVSRNKITVRRLDLPSRDPLEIEQMLGLHVIRQVPFSKEEIIWGYQNLGFDGVNNSRILLAIAHRQVLRNIFNVLMSQNILPEAMVLSSQGVVHYLYDTIKDKTFFQDAYLILDIDYNFSDFMLVSNQVLRSDVVISQGAEQLKLDQDRLKFSAELRQALVVFNNEMPDKRPARLFLTGAARDIEPFVKTLLEKDFNLKVQFVENPEIKNLQIKNSADLSITAALGFAYERKKDDINFTIPEAQIKKEIKVKLKQLLTLGVCLAYIFILLGGMALEKLSKLQSYRDNLNIRITKLKLDTGGMAESAQKLAVFRQYWNPKESVLTYLYELNRLCPDNVTVTNFNWEWQKTISIRGFAAQMPDVFSFVSALDSSENFTGVQTNYTRRRTVKGKEMVDFEVGKK